MDNSKIWIFGDSHFYHSNIIEYCYRPFSSVEEMNNTLITNWNLKVKRNDRIFMLGDFCLAGKDKIIEIGLQLNGRKTLILGNHDRASRITYEEAGFEYISKYPIILDNKYILSHEPLDIDDENFINVYAHVHNSKWYLDYTANTFCVSAERINYSPILLTDILKKCTSKNL